MDNQAKSSWLHLPNSRFDSPFHRKHYLCLPPKQYQKKNRHDLVTSTCSWFYLISVLAEMHKSDTTSLFWSILLYKPHKKHARMEAQLTNPQTSKYNNRYHHTTHASLQLIFQLFLQSYHPPNFSPPQTLCSLQIILNYSADRSSCKIFLID